MKTLNLGTQKVFNLLILSALLFMMFSYYSVVDWPRTPLKNGRTKCKCKECNVTMENAVVQTSTVPQHKILKTDAVIILTQARSGSSILGEIFKHRNDVEYFYEPLFGFDLRPCNSLLDHRIATLDQIINCNFTGIKERFDAVLTDHGSFWPRCKAKDPCFDKGGSCCELLSRMTGSAKICPIPVDQPALEKRCRKSQLIALKIITLCELKTLVPLLNNARINVKVINLVRDPRATIKSRIFQSKQDKITQGMISSSSNITCEQLELNANFLEKNISDVIPRDKYIRVRHEDFCTDPVKITKTIYDFVGLDMNDGIRSWLKTKTSSENSNALSNDDVYGTNRNPKHVVSAWRSVLSLEHVLEIQKRCGNAMKKLGYKLITTKEELKNITMDLF